MEFNTSVLLFPTEVTIIQFDIIQFYFTSLAHVAASI